MAKPMPAGAAVAYRADIDGLRAISVIAVLLYHADVPGFRGGYIGVDVFFVISGYLITQQLMKPDRVEIRDRLSTFYLRRARRILPALFVMLCTVTAIAWFRLLPTDLVAHGKYLALNVLMLGNFAGYWEHNYFFPGESFRPLLHLWSIGVEGQFYLLYPLCLLFVLHEWSSRLRSILWIVTTVSLVLCVYGSYRMPSANFYLMPTRGWELGFGSLLALGAWRSPRSQFLTECGAALALAVLLLCAAFYDPRTRYPGLFALPVCIATVLLIAPGNVSHSRVHRLLTLRPLVWLGLVSYSLYLWHVPVLVFLRYCLLHEPNALQISAAILTAVLLAIASWFLIEQPVRTRRLFQSDRSFFRAVCVGAALLLGTGLALWRSEGFEKRFPPEILRYTSIENSYAAQMARCLPLGEASILAGDLCRAGPQDERQKKVLVWGDSHAIALFHAYADHATQDAFSLHFGAQSSCRPLLGAADDDGLVGVNERCARFNEAMIHAVERIDPDIVVLNSYWMYTDSRTMQASDPEAHGRSEIFERALEQTVRRISREGRRICVLHDGPTFDRSVPHVLSMARIRGIEIDRPLLSRVAADAQQSDIDASIDRLEARGLITAVDLRAQLCDANSCQMERDGWPLYLDSNHLSREGARVASPALERCFQVDADASESRR